MAVVMVVCQLEKQGNCWPATAQQHSSASCRTHGADPQLRWAGRAAHTSADRHDRLHGPAGLLRHHPGEGGGGGDCEGEAGGGGGDGGGARARGAGAGGSGWAEGAGPAVGHAALGRKSEFSGELKGSDRVGKLISITLAIRK